MQPPHPEADERGGPIKRLGDARRLAQIFLAYGLNHGRDLQRQRRIDARQSREKDARLAFHVGKVDVVERQRRRKASDSSRVPLDVKTTRGTEMAVTVPRSKPMSGESLRVMTLRGFSICILVLSGGRLSSEPHPSSISSRAKASKRPLAFDTAPRPRRRTDSISRADSAGASRGGRPAAGRDIRGRAASGNCSRQFMTTLS